MKRLDEECRGLRYLVRCAGLPLAVYREVAAHLSQVEGVKAGLTAQSSSQFDYQQSQIESLWVEVSGVSVKGLSQVDRILAYYGDRYGAWEKEVQAD
ncbi:hypothetical protein ACKFKG_30555 [Phormidesmis sp. 146-35]